MRLKEISKRNKTIIFTLIPLFSLGIYLYQKPTTLELSRQSYHDKFHGFWLGQSIGNWTGLITEMDKVGDETTLPFYTDEDWGDKDQKAVWGEYVPHSAVIDFYFEPSNSLWGADDDTDIEYMYLYLLHSLKTTHLSAEQIRDGWLTHTYSETDAPLFQKFPESKPKN